MTAGAALREAPTVDRRAERPTNQGLGNAGSMGPDSRDYRS